jgi:hypothetical protein
MRNRKTKLEVLMIALLGLLAPMAFFPFAPWFVALFERTAHRAMRDIMPKEDEAAPPADDARRID